MLELHIKLPKECCNEIENCICSEIMHNDKIKLSDIQLSDTMLVVNIGEQEENHVRLNLVLGDFR